MQIRKGSNISWDRHRSSVRTARCCKREFTHKCNVSKHVVAAALNMKFVYSRKVSIHTKIKL